MVKVSVIIPVYNVEEYLRQCMDAVVNQTLREIEIICVDDGSTDASPAILAEYAAKDPRVLVLTQRNSGAGVARNAGLDAAKGEYLAFVDPDDFVAEQMLGALYERAVRTEADVIISGLRRVDAASGREVACVRFQDVVSGLPEVFSPEDVADRIFTAFLPMPGNKFVRREFVVRKGIRFQALPRSNDLCFTMTSLALAKRLTVEPEAFYYYRQGRVGSAQQTTDASPLTVCKAYAQLRENLVAAGVLPMFGRSFSRAVFSTFEYAVGTLHSGETAELLYAQLRSMLGGELNAVELELGDFGGDELDYARYLAYLKGERLADFMLAEMRYLKHLSFLRTAETKSARGRLTEAQSLIVAKDVRIEDCEARIKARTKELVSANQLIAAKDVRIEDCEARIKARTKELVSANQLIAAKDVRIAAKDVRIEELEKHIKDICESLPYRLGTSIMWPARKMKGLLKFLCCKGGNA